jgi:hypothetical protein
MVDNGWESINCIPMYIACWWVPHTSSKPPFECSGWVWRRYLCMGILSCTTNRWFFAIPVYEGIYLIPPSFYRIDMKTSLLNYDVYIYIIYIYRYVYLHTLIPSQVVRPVSSWSPSAYFLRTGEAARNSSESCKHRATLTQGTKRPWYMASHG